MTDIEEMMAGPLARDQIAGLLALDDPAAVKKLHSAAYDLTSRISDGKVFMRGLVEFSNICALDCLYCGIRKSNREVERYRLQRNEVVEAARWAARQGYGSCVLQSGERQDSEFTDFVAECVREIKESTRSGRLPQGLGITLSLGEQSRETYQRWFQAGAHRYLLRIETSNPDLFASIHPSRQSYAGRLSALASLKDVGYQVGTGVMIGLPGQTLDDLADDIIFFKERDIDMIGMGPYLVHPNTPLARKGMMDEGKLLNLSLNMIATARLVLRDVNIAATTAMQTIAPDGREQAIACGANVVMPNLTPTSVRKDYLLYSGKPCVDEDRQDCRNCLKRRIESVGRSVGWDEWGDAPHFSARVTRHNSDTRA